MRTESDHVIVGVVKSSVAEGCPFIINDLRAEVGVQGIPSPHPCASKSDDESKTPAGKMEEPTKVISEIKLWEYIRSVSSEMATLLKGGMPNDDVQAFLNVNMEERQRKIEAHCISFDEKLLESAVMIFSATTRHSSFKPWQYKGEEECNGSGFVISGKMILTNAHVAMRLSEFTFISVAKHNSTIRYKATVKKISHECDLAILEVDSNEFWKDMSPLSFGDIPPLHEAVSVVGFPNGYNICVTRGLVISHKFQNYCVSDTELLTIVVDAEIIDGHSGGPVIMQGKVVGVAFQSVDFNKYRLHIGSVIPTSVVMHFLSSSFEESDQHSGFGWLGLTCKYVIKGSVSHRGILVESINSLSGAYKIMETSDILLAIDNNPIENDGTVFLSTELVDFRHLVSMKKPYENILIKLLRDGEVRECNVTLKPRQPHIMVQKHYIPPSYYIFGGFVFVPFTHAYMDDAEIDDDCTDHFLYKTESMAKELDTGEQLVMISVVLRDDNHDVNQDFRRLENLMVHKVNGVEVNNLEHLVELVEGCCTEHLRLDLQDEEVAVLQYESAKEATAGILKRYNIFFSKSQNLRGSD